MASKLRTELEKLESLLKAIDISLEPQPGILNREFSEVEKEFDLDLGEDLRELYLFSNGSRLQKWFVVHLSSCYFCSIQKAIEHKNLFDRIRAEGRDWTHPDPDRDPRIKQNVWFHPKWFPIAEINGFSTTILFDGSPSEEGDYGQIIVYHHDPDYMFYVAGSFIEFFQKSNYEIQQFVEGKSKDLLFLEPDKW